MQEWYAGPNVLVQELLQAHSFSSVVGFEQCSHWILLYLALSLTHFSTVSTAHVRTEHRLHSSHPAVAPSTGGVFKSEAEFSPTPPPPHTQTGLFQFLGYMYQ